MDLFTLPLLSIRDNDNSAGNRRSGRRYANPWKERKAFIVEEREIEREKPNYKLKKEKEKLDYRLKREQSDYRLEREKEKLDYKLKGMRMRNRPD